LPVKGAAAGGAVPAATLDHLDKAGRVVPEITLGGLIDLHHRTMEPTLRLVRSPVMGSSSTTQRYLHPDARSIADAGEALSRLSPSMTT
jgi:hypothetical protein